MNWHETETRMQIMLSVVIMICVLIGTFVILTMSRRENELLGHVKDLSTLNELQAKQSEGLSVLNDIQTKISEHQTKIVEKQAEIVRTQGETNKNLTDEIAEIRRRQNILKRVAEKIGIDARDNHKDNKQKP